MLSEFEIHEPRTLDEASHLLSQYGWDATIYAGGTELLIIMREGLAHYRHLIDIKTIPGLATIEMAADGRSLRIGAAATHQTIEWSRLVGRHVPILAEVETMVANTRVRVAGTIGGNLCFAEPHSDIATLLTAWRGASVTLASASGSRDLPITEFFVDLFTTARTEDEVMTAVRVPILSVGVGGGYQKFVTLERPTATVAAFLTVSGRRIVSADIAVGSVGPIPFRPVEVESLLQGEEPREELFKEAAAVAARAVDPVSDLYGAADYKRHLVEVLTLRALKQARARANGVGNG